MSFELGKTGFKFLIAGALNTGLTYAIYLLLLFALDYRFAYVLSFFSGIAIALVLNSQFVFKTRLTIKRVLGFIAAYCFQLILGILMLQLIVEQTSIPRSIAPLCMMLITVPLSFFLNRYALKRL